MSATADAGLFASYFETALGEPSGQLTIPGFTHPVTGGRGPASCAGLGLALALGCGLQQRCLGQL